MDDLRELLLRLLVQIGHRDTTLSALPHQKSVPSGKDGIVGMLGRHVSGSFRSKVVEFNRRHSLFISRVHRGAAETYLIDTRNDFLGDGHRVDVIGIETITEPTDACGNLSKTRQRHDSKTQDWKREYLIELNPFLSAISLKHGQPPHRLEGRISLP